MAPDTGKCSNWEPLCTFQKLTSPTCCQGPKNGCVCAVCYSFLVLPSSVMLFWEMDCGNVIESCSLNLSYVRKRVMQPSKLVVIEIFVPCTESNQIHQHNKREQYILICIAHFIKMLTMHRCHSQPNFNIQPEIKSTFLYQKICIQSIFL